jgi:DNA-binding transcriptional LysR family regulator
LLEEMQAFAVLAEVGSVQRAATRLGLTQSAVSRQIQRLEHDLRTTLIDRRVKPPRLTPVGWTVLRRCQSILQNVADLRASASPNQEPSGILRLGVGNVLADDGIVECLHAVGQQFPGVAIHIKTDWHHVLIDHVNEGRLDMALMPKRPGLAFPGGVDTTIIGIEPLEFVAGSGEKLPKRVPLERLFDRHWVVKPKGSGTREMLELLLERRQLPFNIAAEVRDENLMLSLVARNLGVGLATRRSVRRHLQANKRRLRVLDVPGLKLGLDIAIVRARFLGNLQTAVDALQQRLIRRFNGGNGR